MKLNRILFYCSAKNFYAVGCVQSYLHLFIHFSHLSYIQIFTLSTKIVYPCFYPVFIYNIFRMFQMQTLWIVCIRIWRECQRKKLLNHENRSEEELYEELNRIKSHYKKIWNLVTDISIGWTGFLHPIDQSIDLLKHSNIELFFKFFPGFYWHSFSSTILFTTLSQFRYHLNGLLDNMTLRSPPLTMKI
jgi:hypothetical protein